MFYYISFLRPPSSISSTTAPVILTPQVANDLRTELFESSEDQDIFYSWIPEQSFQNLSSLPSTKLAKLTTWRPSNAYKEIKVPPPQRVKEGQSWRLLLSSTTRTEGGIICLNSHEKQAIGTTPFPVISMPILFTPKAGKMVSGKQERIERLYRFSAGNGEDQSASSRSECILRVVEQTSFDLDKKIWDSGIGLSSWLADFMNTSRESRPRQLDVMYDLLFSAKTKRIIELGTGTGVVSLVLATARATILPQEDNNAEIYATDLPSALPLLEHNINLNTPLCFPYRPPKALGLDWDEDLPAAVTDGGGIDLIIMADVTYNTSSFPSLIKTLDRLIQLSLRRDQADKGTDGDNTRYPLILLGYKERDEAERTLWDLAKEIGVEFQLVGERKGAGGLPVEVWIGSVCSRG